jgi:hypothetical protein
VPPDNVTTVHTSGLDIESIVAIATLVLAATGTFAGWIGRRIITAVTDLSTKLELELELETRDNAVNEINNRSIRIETTLRIGARCDDYCYYRMGRDTCRSAVCP